ncbi:arginyl-tRNA--protein transferase 1 isoform X2 [Dermacentor silvarum]|uniref:arginyl-tRNA--protein transferase 1 isoform X2 n=1 Tax=Dermacentor silvarum TaxID=543639 RepID=UPI001896F84D|nr:arginyl-tRNA--protein transferase 1 isoform X2 [Dermacentor silvarum]
MDDDYGIVEYFYEHNGHRCGYCKSESSSLSCGMWAHRLTAGIYDDLLNRGWRRSGEYCYKPVMKKTCCRQYPIKLDVAEFSLTKSQKKLLKRIHKFLATGKRNESGKPDEKGDHCSETMGDRVMEMPDFSDKKSNVQLDLETCNLKPSGEDTVTSESAANEEIMISDSMDQHPEKPQECSKEETVSKSEMTAHVPKKGLGADPNKPKCRKARDIRRERKLLKLSSAGKDLSPGGDKAPLSSKKPKNEPKSLEDFLFEPLPPDAAHKLEVRLVWNSPDCPEFAKSFDSALAVYFRYQEKIHKDSPEKLTERRYRRFLVNSPIQYDPKGPYSLGSFHQQYWLDGNLIAVGVIDILPTCLSSVYLYYNPDYSFLSLGTYASLREIAYARELQKICPSIKDYCMGFYIHTCPKMRYKGNFSPSRLLCPETYTWHPIEKCKPLLDANKYCRFEQDPNKGDENAVQDLDEVSILYNRTVITYKKYCRLKGNADKAEVKEYANLVGKKCIKRLFLYRKS